MSWVRIAAVVVCLGGLLGVPLALSPRQVASSGGSAAQLIIITPHNEQIRSEFAAAFSDWHQRKFGQDVEIAWSTPGGTSEIVSMLKAQYTAGLRSGQPPGGSADLVFGGGSYEHGQLTRAIEFEIDGQKRSTTISAPVDFTQEWLDETYGPNSIGDTRLYDPQHNWFGVVLSGFGIVYNRDVLRRLGVDEPATWPDLCDPRLRGWVALVNPAQSGSITTAFEAILQRRGWEEGWRILRRAAANARYFSAAAATAPIDVSLGDAAAGVCIDFFGRYQSQAIAGAGGGDRVGYVDPVGETSIDSDPVSVLRGAPHPELARRFIEFCVTDEGQALWQFRLGERSIDGLGPRRFEPRRMPIVRSMYARHMRRMVDQVNPYEIARAVEKPNRDMRPLIAPLFAAMAMDNQDLLQRAWSAIVDHAGYPAGRSVVTADGVADPALKEMLRLFDSMPTAIGPDGTELSLETASNLAAVPKGWKTPAVWPPDSDPRDVTQLRFASYFADKYRRIIDLGAGR